MSYTILILIKNKQLQTINTHYKIIKKITENNNFEIQPVKTTNTTKLDTGYILLDYDKKIIINAQNAFDPATPNGFQKIIV